jgi:hypothetical protein
MTYGHIQKEKTRKMDAGSDPTDHVALVLVPGQWNLIFREYIIHLGKQNRGRSRIIINPDFIHRYLDIRDFFLFLSRFESTFFRVYSIDVQL